MNIFLDGTLLLEQFKRGNQIAFKKIYDTYKPGLSHWLRGYWKSGQEEERYDVMATAFYWLYLKREDINDLNHIRAFLITKCKWECIDIWRKEKPKVTFKDEIQYLSDNQNGDEESYLNELQSGILKLKGRLQEILILSIYGQRSMREIADALNIDHQTALNLRARAVEKLRRSLSFGGNKNTYKIYI